MSEHVIQSSFNSGEWSPKLYARVDLAKYRSGAALLLNYIVDYRGGASTRPGTKYVLQCYKSATAVRLIPFQASFNVGYVLEFGALYVRFHINGAPVLEAATTISAINIGTSTITDTAHGYSNGDWIYIAGIVGTVGPQLNGNYYIIAGAATNTYTLTDLFGNAIVLTGAYTSGGTAQRVYTLASPYAASELSKIKFAQNVAQLILCHPNHPPYSLTLITATNWTLAAITFGASIAAPSAGLAVATTLGAGSVNYAYVVTSVDANGQESGPSAYAILASKLDLRTTAGTNTISWTAVAGAISYNIYKSDVSYAGAVPAGVNFGFIGNITGVAFIDSNIGPDYSQGPPVPQNPFGGTGVQSITLTAGGSITPGGSNLPIPTVSFSGGGGSGAAALAVVQASGFTISSGGLGYNVGQIYAAGVQGIQILCTSVSGFAVFAGGVIVNTGTIVGYIGDNDLTLTGSGVNTPATVTITYKVASVGLTAAGTGYATPPTPAFSYGGATATTTLGAPSSGNPSVPGFFQQRLVLAGPVGSPQQFNMSRPGIYFNFDVSQISEADDAIQGTLVSGQLNSLKAMVPQTSGLLLFGDRNSWLINGGSNGSAVTPSALVANAQSFNGISDVPPIVANFDVLYVQAKGSIVRDSAYNIYANVYTGTDISAISSHLFYGYTVTEWAWAEEPFKVVWAIRSDGAMLTLTFLKEQEFIGWAHSTTQGSFTSVVTVIENTPTAGEADVIYTVVQRTVQGQSLKYIERIAERTFPNGVADAWCVDCGIQYVGTAATTFSGAQFLAGLTCTGLADGVVIPPFVMPANGTFTLGTAASKVTVGLGYTCDLQTLPLEIGDPTVQGEVKKINNVDVRVADTLGLSIGSDFNHLVPMKDLIIGNVSSMLTGQTNQIVTGLVSGDARTILDPTYTVPGQYCIRQSNPLPATILGVIPDITRGDRGRQRQ